MPRPPKPTDHLDAVRHLMGTMPDHQVAELCGSTASIVGRYRRKHDIPAYEGYKFGKGQKPPSKVINKKKASKPRRRRSKIDAFRDQVGKIPDAKIAEMAGVSVEGVRMYRRRHGIALEPSARRRRGSRKAAVPATPAVEIAAVVEAAADEPKPAKEARPRRSRRSKVDPYRDQVGIVPDSEIAALAEVTPEAVRMYRRKHNIPATWRKPSAEEAAPVTKAARAEAPRSAPVTSQGYAITVTNNGETQELIVIANDIASAATSAVARVSGTVSAIRHLGPALT